MEDKLTAHWSEQEKDDRLKELAIALYAGELVNPLRCPIRLTIIQTGGTDTVGEIHFYLESSEPFTPDRKLSRLLHCCHGPVSRGASQSATRNRHRHRLWETTRLLRSRPTAVHFECDQGGVEVATCSSDR